MVNAMKSTKDERIQKSVASSNAPSQVVRKPIPALSLLIAATHQSALLPTSSTAPELPTGPEARTVTHKKDSTATMDTKFPVTSRTVNYPLSPATPRKPVHSTPPSYCGKLETKQNLEHGAFPAPTFNPWSAEAFSIFEGNSMIKNILHIASNGGCLLIFIYNNKYSKFSNIIIYLIKCRNTTYHNS